MAPDDAVPGEEHQITPKPEPSTVEEGKESGPEKIQRAVRKLSDRGAESVTELAMVMSGSMMGHPLHQKMTEEHITKMLDLSVQHDAHEFELKKAEQANAVKSEFQERCFHLIFFSLFLGLIVFVIAMLYWQPAVLMPVLTGVGGLVTGFVGGMGYAKAKPSSGKKD